MPGNFICIKSILAVHTFKAFYGFFQGFYSLLGKENACLTVYNSFSCSASSKGNDRTTAGLGFKRSKPKIFLCTENQGPAGLKLAAENFIADSSGKSNLVISLSKFF